MNGNELYLVEYNFDNPIIQKIDSLIDNSMRLSSKIFSYL